jgi:CheY-like chemotaxis protein
MSTDSTGAYEILLVEDDEADIALITEAFATHRAPVRLHTARGGMQALMFLRREDGHTEAPRPNLILRDLNVPRMDGQVFLTIVKNDPDLGTIPAVVFTTSDAPPDTTTSYTAHANAHVTKPLDLDEFDAAVSEIYDFYGQLAVRPRHPAPPPA